MRTMLGLALAAGVGGCLGLAEDLDRPVGMPNPGGDWSVKAVDAKYEPVTLVARDRTRCTVAPERFKTVRIGDRVGCYWIRDG